MQPHRHRPGKIRLADDDRDRAAADFVAETTNVSRGLPEAARGFARDSRASAPARDGISSRHQATRQQAEGRFNALDGESISATRSAGSRCAIFASSIAAADRSQAGHSHPPVLRHPRPRQATDGSESVPYGASARQVRTLEPMRAEHAARSRPASASPMTEMIERQPAGRREAIDRKGDQEFRGL